MPKISPRLGYYIISLGTVLQFLGLSGDSWLSDSGSDGALSFSHPGDVLLVLGMVLSVIGILIGFYSLAETMPNERDRAPRLLPALPLVLLVGLSIGTVAFAYQASRSPSESSAASVSADPGDGAAPTPFAIPTEGPNNCPEGTTWHPIMGHCMTPEAIEKLENAQCPQGYLLDPNTLTCIVDPNATNGGPGVGTTGPNASATPVCPSGFFWHPVMDHCMETSTVVCPTGYVWSTAQLSCVTSSPNGTITTPEPNATPSCPAGTYWHPVMVHCMSNQCPPGFQYDYNYATCLQVGTPQPRTPTPVTTPTPVATGEQTPTQTPTPTPTGTPYPQCPSGYFWHPAMGHCMSRDCPPGLVFDEATLFCVLPGDQTLTETPVATATPTSTPYPQCPSGYFWHPAMGHCMSNTCPPGLVFDPATLYCVLPGSESHPTETPVATATPQPPTPTATISPPTPTGTPYPECPSGYFWHPAMGHCMSNSCPPGLVFDPGTLYCVLPP